MAYFLNIFLTNKNDASLWKFKGRHDWKFALFNEKLSKKCCNDQVMTVNIAKLICAMEGENAVA